MNLVKLVLVFRVLIVYLCLWGLATQQLQLRNVAQLRRYIKDTETKRWFNYKVVKRAKESEYRGGSTKSHDAGCASKANIF